MRVETLSSVDVVDDDVLLYGHSGSKHDELEEKFTFSKSCFVQSYGAGTKRRDMRLKLTFVIDRFCSSSCNQAPALDLFASTIRMNSRSTLFNSK